MKSERPRHHRPAARLCATPVRGGGAHRLAPFGRIHGGGDGLPEKVDQVPARSAARIEHAHPRPNTAPEQLIEEVDVDLAELLLKIGHWFSPDHTLARAISRFPSMRRCPASAMRLRLRVKIGDGSRKEMLMFRLSSIACLIALM